MERISKKQGWLLLASALMFVASLAITSAIAAEEEKEAKEENEQVLSFAKDTAGSIPADWKVAETKGKGNLAVWKVAEDPAVPGADKKVVTITENKNAGGTFSLLINQKANYKDLELGMSLKAQAGEEDQGGGPVWRVKDANNYYITRWNPLEDDLRLYYVKDGKRVQIASTTIKTDPKAWHEIEVTHIGDKIEVEFDGKKALAATDKTFPQGGMVGYWIKADGRSSFSPIKVEKTSAAEEAKEKKEGKDEKDK